MATAQRIKVKVADLIEAIEAKKHNLQREHEDAIANYGRDLEAWHVYQPVRYNNEIHLPLGLERPAKPVLNVQRIDRDLAMLKMSADDILSIAVDSEWGQYL